MELVSCLDDDSTFVQEMICRQRMSWGWGYTLVTFVAGVTAESSIIEATPQEQPRDNKIGFATIPSRLLIHCLRSYYWRVGVFGFRSFTFTSTFCYLC